MKLTQYNNYKNTNIHWLGDIPQHWELKRNKSIFFEVSNLSKTGTETLLTVSHITGVTPRSEKNVNMFLAETMEGYKICQKGDLIINTMWAWMGALGTSKYEGICSPAYNIYRSRKWINIDPRFFDYLYRTPMFVKEMTKYSKGIVESRLRLYPKDFFQINTGLPPLSEQTAIANYLDQKTAQIDKKVELLTQKIEKYKELKKSLINQTVCRGLDKNVKLKPSDFDWIGDIPEHWEVKRFKDMFNLFTGNSISDKNLYEIKSNSIDYVATKDIDFETGRINYDNGIYVPKNEIAFKIAKANSTLICIEGASAGKKIGFTAKNVCFVNKLCCIKSHNKKGQDKFFYYFTQSILFDKQFFSVLSGMIGGVSINTLKYFNILLPPPTEQTAIAQYLNEKTNKIDQIIANLSQQIEVLRELRKTLINEVVTGKVRVID